LIYAGVVKSITNNITMDYMYAELLELTNFLVTETMKQEDMVYVSAEGLVM
jgi:hypothetical protein